MGLLVVLGLGIALLFLKIGDLLLELGLLARKLFDLLGLGGVSIDELCVVLLSLVDVVLQDLNRLVLLLLN